MPKITNKCKVIDSIFLNASIELSSTPSSDEAEADTIHDNLIEDIELVS